MDGRQELFLPIAGAATGFHEIPFTTGTFA